VDTRDPSRAHLPGSVQAEAPAPSAHDHGSPDAARLKEAFLLAAEASEADRPSVLERLGPVDSPLRRAVERLLHLDDAAAAASLVELVPDALDHAAHDRPEELDPGPLPERIGRYDVVGLLGAGTGGVVYLARQTEPDRAVAVKLLRVDAPIPRRRLERESELMAGLQHPAIAHVYERGIDGPTRLPYIVMELVPDALPITRFAATRNLCIDDRVSLLLQACEAMQHSHAAGVIHRDLKPANLLVTPQGTLKIVDFGVGRLLGRADAARVQGTLGPSLVGTLGYASPEQLRGIIGTEGDVYSLGAVLYELICGRPPIELDDAPLIDALARIESGVPTPPRKLNGACSAELEAITLKAVDPDPSRRYPTVAQFADDLRRLQAGEAVSARRDGTWRAVGRWTRRHPFTTGVAATVSAATIAWAGWAWQQHQLRMHAATAMAAATVKVLDFADTRPGNVAIRQLLAETYLPVTEQLVKARPSDADAKLFLARLLETQASVILVGGDHAAGGELRRRVLSLYDELCAADPDSIELAHQRSIAIVRVGDVLMPSDAEQGGSMYREAMRIQQELVDRGAGDASLIDDLGWSYGRMARICLLQNEPLDAIAWLERQTDIALQVRAIDPAVPRSYWTEAFARQQMADALKSLRRHDDYSRQMRDSMAAAERLVSISPDDRTALFFHAGHALRLARDVEVPAGQLHRAAQLAGRARESILRITRWEPDPAATREITKLFDEVVLQLRSASIDVLPP
jgi:hypothetical protein